MKEKILTNQADAAAAAEPTDLLIVEQFLTQNYEFQDNVLSGKMEVRELPLADFKTLTEKTLNSIAYRARTDLPDVNVTKRMIQELVYRDETAVFDPIREYLTTLPRWDGRNRVTELFGRLPGISAEQVYWLSIWLRSVVAHWLQMDELHGNECVPTLVGAQGCGKTLFCRRLLPQQLRVYMLDHLTLSNRFDKDMAVSRNLLVVLDEIEQIKPGQQALLKHTLSRNRVNGRPIFGRVQEDLPRYASFVGTTNNPHPLIDYTGSRRFICVAIPQGCFIDNERAIDYDQLYAQLMHEVADAKMRYWFTNDEVESIQKANVPFQRATDLSEMLDVCFRLPKAGECGRSMSMKQIMDVLKGQYPTVTPNHSMKMRVGVLLKEMGFEMTHHRDGNYYQLVVRKAA